MRGHFLGAVALLLPATSPWAAVEDVTGHVDMWITWIDATTLVVGEYTTQQDATDRAGIEQAVEDQLSGLVDPVSGDPIEILTSDFCKDTASPGRPRFDSVFAEACTR